MNHDSNILSTGTTIMAMVCADGVLLAADSRATTGPYVAMRDMNKVTPITPYIYVCHSGSAADTEALAHIVTYYTNHLAVYSNTNSRVPVEVVAQVLRKFLQKNKEALQAQMIIAGVDDKGPSLYMLMQSGCAIQRIFAAGGSGSTYITSYCDQFFKPNMTVEEGRQFALKAINHATIRDGYSGGTIKTVSITNDGAITKLFKPSQQPLDYKIVKT